jgi:prepilin-type N-terminal cleavage/methylation domain-containing protein
MERTVNHHARGLTAIELLIVLSIIAMLAVFGVPMLQATAWKSELNEAADITEKTVGKARTMARLYKTEVVVRIEEIEDQPPTIMLSMPRKGQGTTMGDINEKTQFSNAVRLQNGRLMMEFDANGEIDFPTTLLLVSANDPGDVLKLVIE